MGERRFLVLDGMRGIAAFAVLMLHIGGVPAQIFGWGHLAVDFFFALSGFVLAHAYGQSSLSPLGFLRARAIRLYPLYLAGSALGAVALAFSGASLVQVVGAAAFAVFCLPAPFVFSGPAWVQGYLYPLDPVAWSLLCEVIANAIWFPLRRRLSGAAAVIALAACAALFGWTYLAYDGVNGGDMWGNVWGGFGRALFSFLAGILTYGLWRRSSWRPKTPSWLPAAGLILVLVAPIDRTWLNAPLVMLFVPCLVYLGACSEATSWSSAIHRALGDASYAVYTLQFPILVAGTWLPPVLKSAGAPHVYLLTTSLQIAGVGVAALWMDRVYDRPLRRWLASLRPPAAVAASAQVGDEAPV